MAAVEEILKVKKLLLYLVGRMPEAIISFSITSPFANLWKRLLIWFLSIFSISSPEYEIEGGTEDRATVIFKCDSKIVNSKVYLTTDDGAFTGFLFMYPALNEGTTHTLEEILD